MLLVQVKYQTSPILMVGVLCLHSIKSRRRLIFVAIGKAFRHGDIEDILSELVKTAGSAAGGASLLGFAQSLLSAAAGGAKFSHEDVKKVYFVSLFDYNRVHS